MCDHHPTLLSRRRFGGLAAVGLGLSLLPTRAFALDPEEKPTALGLMCIDYRYVNYGVDFFNRTAGDGDFDNIELAGASLAAYSPSAFPEVTPAFWEQVAAARYLHPKIARVLVLDHMRCGAFKVQFGEMTPEQERLKHIEVAQRVAPSFGEKGLRADFWLLDDPAKPPEWIWPLEKR
jgi:hypothetical protein